MWKRSEKPLIKQNLYEDTIKLELGSELDDVSFSKIRENIDRGRDISNLLTMRGADHYGSVPLHEIYFGCKNKYTKEGLETECQELPGQLYERIQSAYRELEKVSDNV